MLLLNVPYAEKDQAKSLGAGWNPALKRWYVEDKKEYEKFIRWYPNLKNYPSIACDFLFIVTAPGVCEHCLKNIQMITLAAQNLLFQDDFSREYKHCYYDTYILLLFNIYNFPSHLISCLETKFYYYPNYINTFKNGIYAGHCPYCHKAIKTLILYEELDSPFDLDIFDFEIDDWYTQFERNRKAEKLKFYKVPLKYDIFCNVECKYDDDMMYGVSQENFNKYFQIENLRVD